MNNGLISINVEPVEVKPTFTILFITDNDKPWIMKLSKENGIMFNREAYPDSPPDEFALAVIQILENTYDVTFNRREPTHA